MLDPHQIPKRIAIVAGVIVLAATLLPSAVARPIPDGGEVTETPKAVVAPPTALNAPHVVGYDPRLGYYAKVAGAGRFIDY